MAAITLRLRCEALEARRLMATDLMEALNLTVQSPELEGLRAAEIQLRYDPSVLNLEASDIQVGDSWVDKASLVTNVDQAAGAVSIFLFSVEPIVAKQGGLVDLQFGVSDALAEDIAAVSVAKVSLNEGELDSKVALVQTQTMTMNMTTDQNEVVKPLACSPWPKIVETPVVPTSHPGNETIQSAETPTMYGMATPLIKSPHSA